MNTKATSRTQKRPLRVICAMLAVLMVLALCPVMALDAATPSYDVWDGIVAGTDKTVPELMASNETLTITEDVSEHLEKISDKSGARFGFAVHTAEGFALLSVLTNKPNQFIVEGINTEATTVEAILGQLTGKIVITDDLYLNDPTVAPAQWTNRVLPLWANSIPQMGSGNLLDGQGNMIYGWYVNEENVRATEQRGWGLIGNVMLNGTFTVKSLAMVNAVLSLPNASNKNEAGKKATFMCGGLVGNIVQPSTAGGSKLVIKDCAVSIQMNIGYDVGGDLSFGSAPAVMAGGLYSTSEWGKTYDASSGTYANATRGTHEAYDCIISFEFNGQKAQGGNGNAYCGAIQGGQWSGSCRIRNILIVDTALSGTATTNTAMHDTQVWSIGWDGPCYGIWSTGKLHTNLIDHVNMQGKVSNRQNVNRYDMLQNPNYLEEEMALTFEGSGKKFTPFTTWIQEANCFPVPGAFAENPDVSAFMCVLSEDKKEVMYQNELNDGMISTITSADDLVKYANFAEALAKPGRIDLRNDIDMTGKTMPTFDQLALLRGNGHIISNLTINRTVTNADTDKIGGFADLLGEKVTNTNFLGGVMEDVAFVNYNLTVDATARTTNYYVGGLFGTATSNLAGSSVSTIQNVYLNGNLKVNGSAVGTYGGILGTFGGVGATSNTALCRNASFENCIFVGTASAPRAVAPFMETILEAVAGNALGSPISRPTDGVSTITKEHRQIKLTNCYSLIYNLDANGDFESWAPALGYNAGLHQLALRNTYQAGLAEAAHVAHADGAHGYTTVVDENGKSLWYLDCFNVGNIDADGLATIPDALSGDKFYLDQFVGLAEDNAMAFSNPEEWLYFADGTPIPAVFGDNAQALSISANLDDITAAMEAAVEDVTLEGAGLFLYENGAIQIRFDANAIVSELGLGKVAEYNYGVVILPKLLLDKAGATTLDVTSAGAFLATGTPDANGSYSVYTAILPDYVLDGANLIDAREMEFVAVAYFSYKQYAHDEAICFYSDLLTISAVEVANLAIADGNESDEVENAIVGAFEDCASFVAPQPAPVE
jgi:hypothetical protein